jgi:cobalt/nickel transport system permease protein
VNGEGFLTKNISSFTNTLESVIVTEGLCKAIGLLQRLDPRVKVATFVLFIILVGLARSLWVLLIIFAFVLPFGLLSKIPLGLFLKRILLFIPIFTVVIALPALFITPGSPLVTIANKVIITEQGARTAELLFLRVTDSLSFGVLLILTTPWPSILVALRWFRMPSLLVDILGMTHRYIVLLLHTTNSMFLARRSRIIGSFSGGENRRWLTRTLATVMAKSQHLSGEVYLAMLSRGYQGEVRVLNDLRLRRCDILWIAFASVAIASILLWGNRL